GRLRVRPSRDGGADHAKPRVQREVGERWGREAPSPRSPVRVDSAGVQGMGRASCREAWVLCPVPAGWACGWGARATHTDGSVRASRRRQGVKPWKPWLYDHWVIEKW